MTVAECLLLTGTLLVLLGFGGIVSTVGMALHDWLEGREG
jgi:hypothetical protein